MLAPGRGIVTTVTTTAVPGRQFAMNTARAVEPAGPWRTFFSFAAGCVEAAPATAPLCCELPSKPHIFAVSALPVAHASVQKVVIVLPCAATKTPAAVEEHSVCYLCSSFSRLQAAWESAWGEIPLQQKVERQQEEFLAVVSLACFAWAAAAFGWAPTLGRSLHQGRLADPCQAESYIEAATASWG